MERILLRGRWIEVKEPDGCLGKVSVCIRVGDECEIVGDPTMAEGAGADGRT